MVTENRRLESIYGMGIPFNDLNNSTPILCRV